MQNQQIIGPVVSNLISREDENTSLIFRKPIY